jgi:hypothetical protein
VSFFNSITEYGSFQARDDNGDALSFAVLTFWQSRTNEPKTVYADEEFFIELNDADGKVAADADGIFPLIFMDAGDYRVRLETQDGILRWDIDPYRCECGLGASIFRSPVFQALTPPFFEGPSVSGATLTFTDAATGDPAPVYADDARTIALPNPFETNAAGICPVIYLDDGTTYRVQIVDSDGATLLDLNPYACSCGTIIEFRYPGQYFFNPKFGATPVAFDVYLIGAGAGGGSGSIGTAERARNGGGGGGGGGVSETLGIPLASIGDGVTITVGAGGSGAAPASGTAGGINGNDGASGGDSSFGALVVAGGGKHGVRGGVAGGGNIPIDSTYGKGGVGNVANGGDGGAGGGSDSHAANAGESSTRGGGGGGGGGGKDSNTNYGQPASGGNGNTAGVLQAGGVGGTAGCGVPGEPGETIDSDDFGGGGGGGGGAPTCGIGTVPGRGGDGGGFGGGGGGGGEADTNGGLISSGAGGNGAGGYVRVSIKVQTFYRITEDGRLRVTEAGTPRVTEAAP